MIFRAFFLLVCLLLALPLRAQVQASGGEILTPSPSFTPSGPGGTVLPELDNKAAEQKSGTTASDADPGPVTKYVKPTWTNLLRAMVRQNALDIKDNDIIDEYAAVAECDIYAHFIKNDFMWHKIEDEFRASLTQNLDSLPAFFHYDVKLQFEHYDFDKNMYLFTDKTKIRNVNAFTLFRTQPTVCKAFIQSIPQGFHAVIPDPLRIYGISLPAKTASDLFDRMEGNGNPDHIVYTRFNLHVTYIAPVEKRHANGISGKMIYEQMGQPAKDVRFDTALDSIEFYEDKDMTKLIYIYTPDKAAADKTAIPDKLGPPSP